MQYSQSNRPLAITTPLGANAVLLERLRGTAGISELFRYELDLLAPRGEPVPFEKLLGQNVSVKLIPPDGIPRYFHGFISRLSRGRRDAHFARFRAELVPRLWLLSRNLQYRIFQQQTVPQILTALLAPLRPNFRLALASKYHARDYCVQYRESDFAFLSRLMEEEGIYYYFEHDADKHVLVISDGSSSQQPITAPDTVPLTELSDGRPEIASIYEWERAQEVRPGQYTVWDHCFELVGQRGRVFQNLEGRANVFEASTAAEVRLEVSRELEVFEYPGGYAGRYDGIAPGGARRSQDLRHIYTDARRTAKLRLETDAAQSLQARGESDCARLEPGFSFTLAGDADEGDAGRYLVTHVQHEAAASGFRSGEAMNLDYHNDFSCLPTAVPFRPQRRTPKPSIIGVQTATVVGLPMMGPDGQRSQSPLRTPDGKRIELPPFTDKYGRVKVQFHWDRQGTFDLSSSCWVRVSQTWAGNRSGAFFWPRPGHEVVVTFEEGDPDRPLITGSVYNAANMPPVPLTEPGANLVSGFRSLNAFAEDTSAALDAATQAAEDTVQAAEAEAAEVEVAHDQVVAQVQAAQDQAQAAGEEAQQAEEQAKAETAQFQGQCSDLYLDARAGLIQMATEFGDYAARMESRFLSLTGPDIVTAGAVLNSALGAAHNHPRNYLSWPGAFASCKSKFSDYADFAAAYMAHLQKLGYDPYAASFRLGKTAEKLTGDNRIPPFFRQPMVRKLFSLLLQPGRSDMLTGDQVDVILLGDRHSRITGGGDVRYVFESPLGLLWGSSLRKMIWYFVPTGLLIGGGLAYYYQRDEIRDAVETQFREGGTAYAAGKFIHKNKMEKGIAAALGVLLAKKLLDPSGSVEMVVGPKMNATYNGPKFAIERCRTYTYQNLSAWGAGDGSFATLAAGKLAMLVYLGYWAADVMTKWFNEGGEDEPDLAQVIAVNGKEAMKRLHGILIWMEQRMAVAAVARSQAAEVKRQTKLGAVHAAWAHAGPLQMSVRLAKDMLKTAACSLADLVAYWSPDKTQQVGTNHCTLGHYGIKARTVSVLAQDNSLWSLDRTTDAGNILLSAAGTGGQGNVHVNASNRVELQTDKAHLVLQPTDITLARGTPVVGPKVKMDDDGVHLTCGLQSVSVTPKGINLSSGISAVASKIAMTPAGIKLSWGATTSIELSPKGIKINGMKLDLNALTQFTAKGLQAQMQGAVMGETGGTIARLP